MSYIKASIVINTKDRISRLHTVLKALEGQVDNSVEVILVFDGCEDETLNTYSKINFSYPITEIVSKKNVGRSASRNLGAKKAKGEIIIFIDDDRVPCRNFVKMHIEGHKEPCILLGNRKDIHMMEYKLEKMMLSQEELYSFLDDMESNATIAFDSHDKLLRKLLFFRYNPIIWIVFYTGNVSLERESLLKAGLFDENFKGWGYEDLELGYRLYKQKIKFVKSHAAVSYHLTHEISVSNMLEEALKNLKYFSKKVKGDILAKLVIFLLAVPLYLRIFQRYFIRTSFLKGKPESKDTH
ncbi:glycosyltransferase involved in cell wall biosynthesis [Ruminiclostridium sufflavum DSM 19573]|uniref:Glycosyltransferase involved in cell wall biosynthesis n=1 Tax=Ruminiclostridium sufflavum DSM 19573 TaxID=1121337 RepID=A0A318XMC3_9FIRM|nr:glycosyltransferase [Ruminiclostridium sufflavum]PYG87852.1 glycosyltransferase involved in cell wall biosynthesis [Ruminiclostridium sufflavum DSM 19573]